MRNSNNIIVQEYLSSLKEDRELDYLFPILLNSMGFRIVQTAKESKGQSQYGKDIIATGPDQHGVKHRWYFELKGYDSRDITHQNYFATDGIRESIIEAKDTAFNDSSINGFNQLPIKIVLVHNGILKTNIRPTFEGLIAREFKEGEFERWDIYYLTDLFAEHLFSEYLLSDSESNILFKKTLAFLDAPDNDFGDFKSLVNLQLERTADIHGGRALTKLFATLNLLAKIVYHYSKENDNLIAAKHCSKILILSTWAWILEHELEEKKGILHAYKKLLQTHFEVMGAYFSKTFPIAKITNGLFSEYGGYFEIFGYPLRCFEYLEDCLDYCNIRLAYPNFNEKTEYSIAVFNKQKDLLIELITNNNGFYRPILDNQSIVITQLFLFFSRIRGRRQKDVDFISSYIFQIIYNTSIEKLKHNRLPELTNNIEVVSESYALGIRTEEYKDSSSILVAVLAELISIFNSEEMYSEICKHLSKDLSLQIAYPNYDEHDIEQLMFQKNMHSEYYVECIDPLPESFAEFKEKVESQPLKEFNFRTDKVGLSFLRYLAHSYFKNELDPVEWRKLKSTRK